MKKIGYIILLIALVILIIGIVFFINHKGDKNNAGKIILFYSKQCPHCENIEAFLTANDIRNKIVFIEKEVSQDRANLMQLVKVQKNCGIPVKEYVEIPLLWTGTKCITGDQEIIKFFQNKVSS